MADTGVRVIDPASGTVSTLPAQEAQAAFQGGRVSLLDDDQHLLVAPDGTRGDFASAKVQGALEAGFRFADDKERAQAAAEAAPVQAFAEGGLRSLSLGATDPALQWLGVEGIHDRAQTHAGTAGELAGLAGSMFIPGVGEAAAADSAAAFIAKSALAPAVKLARGLDATAEGITLAGTQALERLGASQAAARLGGHVAGQAAIGAGVGAVGAVSEEMVGDPQANAEALMASGLAGALTGGVFGGALGGAVGTLANRATKRATLALPTAEDLAAGLTAAGVEAQPDSWVVRKYIALQKKFSGAEHADIDLVNTKAGQQFLKEGEAGVEQSARNLTDVVDRMAQEQARSEKLVSTLRSEKVAELLPATAANPGVAQMADAFESARTEITATLENADYLGLSGADRKNLADKLKVMDAAQAKVFEAAGVAQEQSAFDGAGFAQRKPPEPPKGQQSLNFNAPPTATEAGLEEVGSLNHGQQTLDLNPSLGEEAFMGEATGAVGAEQGRVRDFDANSQAGNALRESLPKDEQQALGRWQSGSYENIRIADRGGKAGDAASEAARLLNKTVAEHGTEHARLYRGINVTDEVAAKLLSSSHLDQDALSSWSINPQISDKFAGRTADGRTGIMFRLTGDVGIPVRGAEAEVLTAKKPFRIKEVTQSQDGRYDVLLERMEGPAPKGAAVLPEQPRPAANPAQLSFSDLPSQPTRKLTLRDLAEKYHLPPKAGQAAFEGLDAARQVMGRVGKHAEVAELAAAQRSALTERLRDSGVWGDLAKFQTDLDTATRARSDAWAKLQKQMRFLGPDQVDPKAVHSYARGLERMKGDAVVDALNQWHEANQLHAELTDAHYRGAKLAKTATKLGGEFEAARKDLSERAAIFNAIDRMEKVRATDRGRGVGDTAKYTGGALLGSALGIHGIGAIAAVSGASTLAFDPARIARLRTQLPGHTERVAGFLNGLAKAAGDGRKAVVPEWGPALAHTTRAMLSASTASARNDAVDARLKELDALAQPEVATSHATTVLGDLADAAPNHAIAAQLASQQAVTLLQARMPKARNQAAVALGDRPLYDAGDAARFARLDSAIQNPGAALADAVRIGHLTSETRQALETVYPKLWAQFQSSVALEAGKPSSKARAAFLRDVTQGPDTTAESANRWQTVHDAVSEQGGPGQAAQPSSPGGGSKLPPKSAGIASNADKLQ